MDARLATRQKWIAGAKPAAPLFVAITGALCVGTLVGTRHLRLNPEVVVSKSTRAVDLTDSRSAKMVAREGETFHESGFRKYIRSGYFTGAQGPLDNSRPFLMRSLYGDNKP